VRCAFKTLEKSFGAEDVRSQSVSIRIINVAPLKTFLKHDKT